MNRSAFLIFIGLMAFAAKGYGQVRDEGLPINGVVESVTISPDEKISSGSAGRQIYPPDHVKQGKKLAWGVGHFHEICLSEDRGLNWRKEETVGFDIFDFQLLNDSTVVLRDSEDENYIYSLKDHKVTQYHPLSPFKEFLTAPVKILTTSYIMSSCSSRESAEVYYEKVADSTMKAMGITYGASGMVHWRKNTWSTFANQFNAGRLTRLLDSINANPYTVPSLKDFKITERDKQQYLEDVDNRLRDKYGKDRMDKAFYYAIPSVIDSLSDSVLTRVLNRHYDFSALYRCAETLLVNELNDTLRIWASHSEHTLPRNLPWLIDYKGLRFKCYNISYSRFIKSCLPDDFPDIALFDNRSLLIAVADYLWERRKKK